MSRPDRSHPGTLESVKSNAWHMEGQLVAQSWSMSTCTTHFYTAQQSHTIASSTDIKSHWGYSKYMTFQGPSLSTFTFDFYVYPTGSIRNHWHSYLRIKLKPTGLWFYHGHWQQNPSCAPSPMLCSLQRLSREHDLYFTVTHRDGRGCRRNWVEGVHDIGKKVTLIADEHRFNLGKW